MVCDQIDLPGHKEIRGVLFRTLFGRNTTMPTKY